MDDGMFPVMFGIAAGIVGLGFVVVIGLIVSRSVRAARDPEYRALIATQASARRRHGTMDGSSPNPAMDPGDPASPMFPGNADPGGPGSPGGPF